MSTKKVLAWLIVLIALGVLVFGGYLLYGSVFLMVVGVYLFLAALFAATTYLLKD